jgi:hypothetical protein
MTWPDLTPILSPIHWAVVGAAATRLYMPERLTQDLDVAITTDDAPPVAMRLTTAGFIKVSDRSIGGATWRAPDGQLIDVIEGRDEWWPRALTESQTNRDEQDLPILPLRYLVLMKFQASRARDLGDITQMLGLADDAALEGVRALFEQFAPDDMEDLESLITLGRLEMGGNSE